MPQAHGHLMTGEHNKAGLCYEFVPNRHMTARRGNFMIPRVWLAEEVADFWGRHRLCGSGGHSMCRMRWHVPDGGSRRVRNQSKQPP